MDENELGGIGKLSRKRLSEVIRHCKGCIKATDVSDRLQISAVKPRNLLAIWSKKNTTRAIFGCRVGRGVANVWNIPHEKKLFYQGYGATKVNAKILAYYRHKRIVEDIAEYGHALLLTTSGGEDRQKMYKHFIAMFEPNGVIDIAFKTDKGFS